MDDLISLVLVAGIIGIVGLFIFYIIKTYVVPKKIDEISEMIRAGQLGPAIKRLQKLIEDNDRDPYTHYLLAEAYNAQKNYPKAMLEYKQVLKINKFSGKVKEAQVRSRLAKLYLAQNNLDEAKKEYLILTKLDPTNADNFFQVAKLFDEAGVPDKAVPYYKQALKINPAHAEAHYRLGVIEYTAGNTTEAKRALTEAVKLDPNNLSAHYYLGMTLKSLKDYEWALKEFDTAARDDKLKAKALLGKGLCYIEKDQMQNAIAEMEKGLSVAPKGSDTEMNLRYFIAAAAERLRDFHTAIAHWERLHDMNPKFRDVAEKLKMYDEFRTDDSIKDFMIASPGKFEMISRKIIEHLGLNIVDLQVINDSEVHCLAMESDVKFRNTKRGQQVIYILRTTDPIPEKTVRALHEEMRANGATRGMCLTTSEFTTQAELFAQSRPIELVDKKEIVKILRAVVS
ncbi:MAG: tetratricopeptide repeat protein [Candidatus Hydrogenedentota bacterium]|nr:MAG: tetratricopeptide repeat protein [Candidatus Hydrogenedentota bacterium]